MNNFFSKLLNLNNDHNTDEKQAENISPLQSEANDDSNAASDTDGTDDTDRYISALLALLADFYGTDKLVIKVIAATNLVNATINITPFIASFKSKVPASFATAIINNMVIAIFLIIFPALSMF